MIWFQQSHTHTCTKSHRQKKKEESCKKNDKPDWKIWKEYRRTIEWFHGKWKNSGPERRDIGASERLGIWGF